MERPRAAAFVSVIVPTYEERANIEQAIRATSAALGETAHEILVVDDASPDGTAEAAERLADDGFPVRVLRRLHERGLSGAVLEGFRRAKGDVFVVMDADGSHPANLIPRLLREILGGADVAVASRRAPGGGVEGWPWRRRAVSAVATRLAAHLTPVRDPLSGFFAVRREVVEGRPLDPRGFKIGLDVLVRGSYGRVAEVPFVFRDRARGSSKLSARVHTDYVRHLWDLTRAADPVAFQAAKYALVGGLGVLVNLAAFALLLYATPAGRTGAAVGSFVAALASNFVWNKHWTFRDRASAPRVVARQGAVYAAIAVAGLAINLVVLTALARGVGLHDVLAQGIGIAVAAAWNFELTRRLAFPRRR